MPTPLPTPRARDLAAYIDALEGILPLRDEAPNTHIFRAMPELAQKTTYSTAEVAEILGVHVETVRRWIRDGKLRAARGTQGRPSTISRAELVRWFRESGGGELFAE
jgi:excisionase family DNA binding protein